MNTQMTWFHFPLFNSSPPLLRTVPFRLIIIYNIDRHDVICVCWLRVVSSVYAAQSSGVRPKRRVKLVPTWHKSDVSMYECTGSDDDIYLENKCSCINDIRPFLLLRLGLSAIGSCLSILALQSREDLFFALKHSSRSITADFRMVETYLFRGYSLMLLLRWKNIDLLLSASIFLLLFFSYGNFNETSRQLEASFVKAGR